MYTTKDFRVTAIIENDQLIKQPGDHIHPSNERKVALKIAHNRAKEGAENQPLKSTKRVFGVMIQWPVTIV